MARVILQCRPTSHAFTDRDILMNEPVKIGRAVANCKPGSDNGYFSCKVLSRNHAVLWYENGKFYIQDTQSSNGTFVNNQKLSVGPPPSMPGGQGTLKMCDPSSDGRKEVTSGDVVQFGVEVVEQAKKGAPPVTHGCIIASLKLFYPDGTEVKPPSGRSSSLNAQVDGPKTDHVEAPKLSVLEMYEIQSSLQEARHREHLLENKLASLTKILLSIERKDTWTATFQEDLLLSKIQYLQAQVNSYEGQFKKRSNSTVSKPSSFNAQDVQTAADVKPSLNGSHETLAGDDNDEDETFLTKVRDTNLVSDDCKLALMADWKAMLEERANFENAAKNDLQRLLNEKAEVWKALAVAEERVHLAQTECSDLGAMCEHTQKELVALADRFQQQSQELEAMGKMYQESERVKLECLEVLKNEKNSLEEQLHAYQDKFNQCQNMYEDLANRNQELQDRIDHLRSRKSGSLGGRPNDGDLIWTNGLSAESDEDMDRKHEMGLGDGLAEQSLPENIFQGKNIVQLVQEFNNASDEDDERPERECVGDGPIFLKNEHVNPRLSPYRSQSRNDGAKLDTAPDGSQLTGNFEETAAEIGELLSANERLTEIVAKLQNDLELERSDKPGIFVPPDTSDAGTSVDKDLESMQSFDANPSLEQPADVFDENFHARMELTALLEDLNTSARDLSPPTVSSFSSGWTALLSDSATASALLLLMVWLAFSVVFDD